jgi:hypothetical protein
LVLIYPLRIAFGYISLTFAGIDLVYMTEAFSLYIQEVYTWVLEL